MNLPKLPRTLALAALTLSLTAGLRAEGPADARFYRFTPAQ